MPSHILILGQLINKIMKNYPEQRNNISIVLMGSFQYKEEANDIDIIVIYEKYNYIYLKNIKRIISESIYNVFKIKVDFITLSMEEYFQMEKLHVENQILIFSTIKFSKLLRSNKLTRLNIKNIYEIN